MRKSIKAPLFSLLLFPGTGHFVVRHWLRGLLFALPVLAACVFIVTYSVDKAFDTVDQILAGEVAADTASIEAALEAPPPEDTARLLDAATWLILACYIGAAVDAAVLGARIDRQASMQEPNQPGTGG